MGTDIRTSAVDLYFIPVRTRVPLGTDIRTSAVDLYFIPVRTRVPLKFGPETLTSVICARVCVTVQDSQGQTARGWGETPLSVQWAWPSSAAYAERCEAMQLFCRMLTEAWANLDQQGHPIELGNAFIETQLPSLLKRLNSLCTMLTASFSGAMSIRHTLRSS